MEKGQAFLGCNNVEEFRAINAESGENVPEKVPSDRKINGLQVACGPILRLLGTFEYGRPNYRGTILVITNSSGSSVKPEICYSIGKATGLEEDRDRESGELKTGSFPVQHFCTIKEHQFWRFSIDLTMKEIEQKVKYNLNGYSEPAYEFFIPSIEQSMNVVSYSCNGFSLGADTSQFKSSLWFDVLKKHSFQHYHVMIGGGDQLYNDAVKLHCKGVQKWIGEKNKLKKYRMKVSKESLDEIHDYYFSSYLAWYGHGYWQGSNGNTYQALFPKALSLIPSVNIYDDHDIIDGFGTYHDITLSQEYFRTIGNVAYGYYMLFQHHTSPDEEAHNSTSTEPSWILSNTTGPYIKQKNHSLYMRLGKEIAFLGLDCRTERKLKQVVSPETYGIVFRRLEKEIKNNPDVKHLLVLLGVPIFYPRMVFLEWILNSPILIPLKKLAAKGIINKGLVNEFDGGVEVLDDLEDHWCAHHHKRERNYLVKQLINFGASHGVRITILSGDVHLCCIGRMRSRIRKHPTFRLLEGSKEPEKSNVIEYPEKDPRLIFNVISSAIVNAPPPNAMAAFLRKRAKIHRFNVNVDEDTIPLFQRNTDGTNRANHEFLNKRNWADLVLASQSLYKDKVDSGITKAPSPVFSESQDIAEKQSEKNYFEYPLRSDSLVTTLHVENDPNDYDCDTAAYEVLIPKLANKYALDKVDIKHLT